jgi:hypothetical protein
MQHLSIRSKRLFIFLSLVFFCSQSALAYDVALRWDPSTNTTVTGYKVHYGSASRSYQTSISIGSQTSYTVTGLGSGTFYFAVSAYNSAGAQSAFSNEVTKTLGSGSGTPASGSLAHSGTMTANSQNFAPDHGVEHLWDSCLDGTSACSSGNTGASSFWIEFDLGQQYTLTSARLFGDADGSWTSSGWSLKFRINPSDSWQTAFSGINAFLTGWSTQSLAVTARYVRVEVAGNATANAIQARELQIYGTVGTPSSSPLPAPTNVIVK